ncbi:hypothetical protein [Aureimonas phyllosphaerae]|uniref:Uncharacterized protein n=1 Tax=Aureimonas phyllosphaerae TaxID=1166078 RepID=A0A7W6FWA3_9HYPH|nr:hypothetical protein [Aureimonas phyllosphaerae]MBB3938114.1 hypothetical protein [Aureimonas phyllosphaerae]MBB3962121.1 hypothetical protein [Aureimonas phyllosphaerae]SFF55828.1 hypothetical protein SAMN05216566_1286 [Aureimonas phyllosphaerae]
MAKKGADTPTEVPIDDLRSFLREEAERGPTGKASTFDQVVALLPEIDALIARRRTRAEVRDLLASKGLEMSLGTFTQYYAKAKRQAEGTDTLERKPTARKPEPAAKNEANNGSSQKANSSPASSGTKPEEKSEVSLRPRNDEI